MPDHPNRPTDSNNAEERTTQIDEILESLKPERLEVEAARLRQLRLKAAQEQQPSDHDG